MAVAGSIQFLGRGLPGGQYVRGRLRTATSSCLPVHTSRQRQSSHMKLPVTRHRCRNGRLPSTSCSVAATPVHTTSFENLHSEQELYSAIAVEVGANRLPSQAKPGMELFYQNYRKAIESSGVTDPEGMAVRVMATVFDRICVQFEDPYTFPSYHRRITQPYDYYAFGQNYVRPLIDYNNSYLGNVGVWDAIAGQLSEGHNVVLLANHQTEADPAVMALMLEASHPQLATDITYVAGDRVVLDPFCKPFSMGRNLLCVFSKKRINDVPELAKQKQAANIRTLKEMARMVRQGGNLIWIAPSGGRDRPDPTTDKWVPAPFDPSTLDMMRRLLEDAEAENVPGHLYPTTLLCHDIMPPPRKVEKELGEVRMIGWHGVGVAVSPEVKFREITSGIEDKAAAREAFADAVFQAVCSNYATLEKAVHDGKGVHAASSACSLAQPWIR